MTYELAKELTDAGLKWDEHHHHFEDAPCINTCYPTLSELIEACDAEAAPKFHLMWKNFGRGWQACLYDTNRHHIYRYGATPEEAVARLWLSLNKHAVA
jgi:hypothetical protein